MSDIKFSDFDYADGICRFDLIPGKRELLFNDKVQSVHAVDETG